MNVTVDELGPVTWTPVTDLERTVYAAMILAGRPVTNAELARFMRCSLGEVSKRVKALEGCDQEGTHRKRGATERTLVPLTRATAPGGAIRRGFLWNKL